MFHRGIPKEARSQNILCARQYSIYMSKWFSSWCCRCVYLSTSYELEQCLSSTRALSSPHDLKSPRTSGRRSSKSGMSGCNMHRNDLATYWISYWEYAPMHSIWHGTSNFSRHMLSSYGDIGGIPMLMVLQYIKSGETSSKLPLFITKTCRHLSGSRINFKLTLRPWAFALYIHARWSLTPRACWWESPWLPKHSLLLSWNHELHWVCMSICGSTG